MFAMPFASCTSAIPIGKYITKKATEAFKKLS
jgi:hypothetical protein